MNLERIVPMLPVRELGRSIAYYEQLGFRVERREPHWGWATVALGSCQLMLDQSIHRHPIVERDTVIYLYPSDVDAFHREARQRGLLLPDIETTFYGMREFRVTDPDGNRLWIGQRA